MEDAFQQGRIANESNRAAGSHPSDTDEIMVDVSLREGFDGNATRAPKLEGCLRGRQLTAAWSISSARSTGRDHIGQ